MKTWPMKTFIAGAAFLSAGALATSVRAQSCASIPYAFTNGTPIDANQVNANFACAALLGAANFTANVGVNDSSPVAPVSLGSTITTIKLALFNGGGTNIYGMGVNSGELTFGAAIGVAGVPQMVLTNGGQVGIGTTTPAAPLDVTETSSGAININGLSAVSFPSDSTNGGSLALGYAALANQSGGAVQVNTAVGGRSLTALTSGAANAVVGYEAAASLTTGSYSTAVGDQALKFATTGGYNTAVGFEAMVSASGSGLSSSQGFNTAVGASAGESLQGSASYDTFIGGGAGQYITTGVNNTVIGGQGGRSMTTGASNTLVGYQAGYNTTTGSRNTFIGNQAGFAITTSTDTTLVGHVAGYNLTTASNTTVLGTEAAYAMTSSTNNTLVGTRAGYAMTTSGNNTLLGVQTGYNLTTGGGNTLVGVQAGEALTTSGGNTIIGNGAGYAATTGANNTILGSDVARSTLTTGSNDILIGTDTSTDAPTSGSQSNDLNIGNAIYGSNLQNNTNTTGSAYIAINTTPSTSYAFYVSGAAGGTTTWASTSDGRLKTGVTPITGALDRVERLQGVRFTWRGPEDRTVGKTLSLPAGQPDIGFIAQEVAAVVPEAVDTPQDPATEVYTLKDAKLIPVLVEAIKEQQAEIKAQQAEIDQLKALAAAAAK